MTRMANLFGIRRLVHVSVLLLGTLGLVVSISTSDFSRRFDGFESGHMPEIRVINGSGDNGQAWILRVSLSDEWTLGNYTQFDLVMLIDPNDDIGNEKDIVVTTVYRDSDGREYLREQAGYRNVVLVAGTNEIGVRARVPNHQAKKISQIEISM